MGEVWNLDWLEHKRGHWQGSGLGVEVGDRKWEAEQCVTQRAVLGSGAGRGTRVLCFLSHGHFQYVRSCRHMGNLTGHHLSKLYLGKGSYSLQ